jgi:hypothetical protein
VCGLTLDLADLSLKRFHIGVMEETGLGAAVHQRTAARNHPATHSKSENAFPARFTTLAKNSKQGKLRQGQMDDPCYSLLKFHAAFATYKVASRSKDRLI